MTFRFKKIPGFNYSVSEHGLIRNDKTGRILKPSLVTGYQRIMMMPGRKAMFVHQVVALAFIGPKTGTEINHIDGNKLNNHYSNLEYCTHRHNYEHAIRTGLRTKNTNRKLTEAQIRLIKAKTVWKFGEQSALARKFNVSVTTINETKKGRIWRDV